ncbi:MAG: 3-phosphoglycerate dehydrogenase family protein [Akkermansia sp.]
MMKKILIPTKLQSLAANLLQKAGYTVVQDADAPLMDQAVKHSDAICLIVRSEKVTQEVIDAFPNLKLVVRAGAGFDTIDIAYARKRGVDVMNTPGANANAVAEEVITLILANYRHVVTGDNTTREGGWEKKNLMGTELTGKTVGIVGLGNIGRLVAKRMQGFEPNVLGYDPVLAPVKARELGIEPSSLDEIFSKSDVVTVHVPGGPDTKNMIDTSLINLMKPNAVLVNCARYGVVSEDAVRAARKAGKNIQYVTDVYPEDKAGAKEVADIAALMMPHLGASTIEANLTAARRAAEQAVAYFEQGISSCVVNKGTPDGLNPSYQRLAWMLASVARYAVCGKPIRQIDCTFYGDLNRFGKWFWAPILAGLSPSFDKGMMPSDASKALQQQGITIIEREPMEQKSYGNSMTIDLITEDGKKMDSLSLRGTITDGLPMISRFADFEGLYFGLSGHLLFVNYKDRPGVIAQIAAVLADAQINIDNIAAPRDHKTETSLAVLRLNQPVSDTILDEIKLKTHADNAFALSF